MKTTIQKLWIIIAMLCTSSYASAYDFVSEGVAYTITSFSDLECCVSAADASYEGDIIIPENVSYKGKLLTVTSIEDEAFANSAITSVILPKSLLRIGLGSFSGCNSLREVSLNEGLQTMDAKAFMGCSSLLSIIFPKTLQSIGESCFEQCASIETVILPNTLTTLSKSAFKDCTNLREITLSELSELKDNTFNVFRDS